MKYKLLRLSLLSLLVMLFGGTAQAGDNDLIWDYTEKAPAGSPDNGMYYASSVNDAAGTNNSLKGIKLNSSGWAYFEKPAVAGTLTLTFGKRSGTDSYAINVSNGTLNADGKSATKGTLIKEVSVAESPGKASLELDADVKGIYIDRSTGAEGVLCKVVFKETVPRDFTDFEITNEQLSGEFDTSTLPAGVSFTGTKRNDSHGYGNVTMVIPVDGTVKFTIGGCQYYNAGAFPVKNAAGETIATLSPNTTTCYHQDGAAITYIYTGEADVLTFGPIQYLPYFKAVATEVSEAVITYKDQNGNKLGTKTVYEGDPVGEIPYTEADLTIPEGQKFRGWVYNSNVKVKATDIVNGDMSISASVSDIEQAPETGSIQTYDLTQPTFYPEDHENFDVHKGAYYNNHGFTFEAGGDFTVAVSEKAQIVLNLCQYGNGTTITVTDPDGNVVRDDVPAKADTDGGTTAINYEGKAGVLTFTFAAQAYLHKVTVFNVSGFLEKDAESGYYIVPANDGASLVLALNSASTEAGSKIFLPNGTYDFGEVVLTGISGTNVSLIGQSMEGVVIKNAPPVSTEGLNTAATLVNSGNDLYMQDLTLQNALDYYNAGSTGRANAFYDKGNHTVAKNVRLLSYQDTYLSPTDKQHYWEGGEIHGTVDYICGGSDVFFEGVKLVNESRKQGVKDGTDVITAHQPKTQEKFGYVFNNCVVENLASKFSFSRAWGGATGATVRPTVTFLNTVLNQPTEIEATRFNLAAMNEQTGVFHEYNSTDDQGNVVSPATLEKTFSNKNGEDKLTYDIILSAEQAAGYTLDKVFTNWQPAEVAAQLEAPAAEYESGSVTWTAVDGATAYLIEKDGAFAGIATGTSFAISIDAEKEKLTIRAANARGGFGEAKQVSGTATSVKAVQAAMERGEQVIYNLSGQRVNKATRGLYIINGHKVVIK